MARRGDTYSRMVAWLKILLPLVALGVLGTVFLVTSEDNFDAGFTFSQADLETLESGSFVTNPQINGVAENNEVFRLTAARIYPRDDDANIVLIEQLNGEIIFDSTAWVRFLADAAVMDVEAQIILFETGGQLETSDGNIATAGALRVHLKTAELSGTSIIANGPLGQISADRFRLDSTEDENHVLWFENNVRMQYEVQNEGE